jgi:hypothetical protein
MLARAAVLLVTAGLLSAQAPVERPRALRAAVLEGERMLDRRLAGMFGVDDPFAVQGVPRGVYLEGWGPVFTAEVNLLQVAGLSPFRPEIKKEEIARVHQKKSERVSVLRERMRGILVDTAAMLDPVPETDRVTLGVTLFYMHWENTSGLPAQIVMSAPKKALVDMKLGRGNAQAIQVREY